MTNLANDSSTSVENFNATMATLNSDATKMADVIEVMENKVFTTLAKIDHIIFKADAYNTLVSGNISKEFTNHTNCRMGKWYTTTGKEKFGHTVAFKSIVAPHKRIHDSVLENVNFMKDEDKRLENEDKIVENFKTMES